MHVPFEAGLGWLHVAHKNADLLLLLSIASLGLLPLVSIYIIETEKYEDSGGSNFLHSTPEVLRSCVRGLIYLAILFPYILALLSTYVSIQLIRGQSLDEHNRDNKDQLRSKCATLFWLFYKQTKVLQEKDRASSEGCQVTEAWKVPQPGDIEINGKNWRLVAEDCAICMHQYTPGERIIWSSNPKCIHCYHYTCLQAWMEPWDARSKRCPCCRQSFFK